MNPFPRSEVLGQQVHDVNKKCFTNNREKIMIQCGRLTVLFTVLILLAASASAQVFVTDDDESTIRFSTSLVPFVFIPDNYDDFSLIGWIRRDAYHPGRYSNVIDGGGVIRIGIDDDQNGITFQLRGVSSDITLLVPLRDGSPETKVPVGEWMLLAMSWDSTAQQLSAWAQSETVTLATDSDADPAWEGSTPWPIRIGAVDSEFGFAGQAGLWALREHQIDVTDFNTLWNGGEPFYFGPAKNDTGNMTGLDGTQWMIGHGIVTAPSKSFNPNAEKAELGDLVNSNNVLEYNHRSTGGYFGAGIIQLESGHWTMESPHQAGEDWSGFFVRQLPDLDLIGEHYVTRSSPKAKKFADSTPDGLIRVVLSSNSRITRVSYSYGALENFAYGGAYPARKSVIAGVFHPTMDHAWTKIPGFYHVRRLIGEVYDTRYTPYNSVSFGRFGSHSSGSEHFPSYWTTGRVAVIEPGGSYITKARPEPGTLFADKTDPLTVRAMVLKFPGAGDLIYQGEKAVDQHTSTVTVEGDPITQPLDTTVYTHIMSPADTYDSETLTFTLDGIIPDIEPGHGCFISAGSGEDGISIVEEVDTSNGISTAITVEYKYPEQPDSTSSVLKFGPVEAIWVEYQWMGLDPEDLEVFRGIKLTADNGIVPVIFAECFNPEADGFIIGPVGRNGGSYDAQLNGLFHSHGIYFMEALQADVWMQLFATQGSSATCMDDYTYEIHAVSPDTEVWWCGDPDFDTNEDDEQGRDFWQQYALDHAAENSAGAVIAHEHPTVGTGNERAVDGQSADVHHISGRGNDIYISAVLEMMQTAAWPAVDPCAADVNGDDQVNIDDIFAVLGYWGVCSDPCPPYCPGDVTGDCTVNIDDIFSILGEWGPCEE